jgi:hypothetical protein
MRALFLFLFLVGCGSSAIRTYQPFDPNDKSVTLPLGAAEPLGSIKDAFIRRGYKIVNYNESVETKKIDDATTVTKPTFSTRYKLVVHSKPANPQSIACWNPADKIEFELFLVDLNNGAEVVSMDGTACANDIAPKFLKAIGLN